MNVDHSSVQRLALGPLPSNCRLRVVERQLSRPPTRDEPRRAASYEPDLLRIYKAYYSFFILNRIIY